MNDWMNFPAVTSVRAQQLINGWYGPNPNNIDQNSSFIPQVIVAAYNPSLDLYQNVIEPGCQTCHAAQKVDEKIDDKKKVCGGDPDLEQNHKMTNSLVPFERMWLKPEPPSSLQPLASKLNLGCSDKPLRHPPL